MEEGGTGTQWTADDLLPGDFVFLYNALADGRLGVGKLAYVGREHFVGRVESLEWSDDMDLDRSKACIRWMYRPSDVAPDLLPINVEMDKKELLYSNHMDKNPVSTVIGKCNVLPYKEYQQLQVKTDATFFWRLFFDSKQGTVAIDQEAVGDDETCFQWKVGSSSQGKAKSRQRHSKTTRERGNASQEGFKRSNKQAKKFEVTCMPEGGVSRTDDQGVEQHMGGSKGHEGTHFEFVEVEVSPSSQRKPRKTSQELVLSVHDIGTDQSDSMGPRVAEPARKKGKMRSRSKHGKAKREQPPLSVSDVPVGSGLDILTEAAALEEDTARERELTQSNQQAIPFSPQGIVLGISDLKGNRAREMQLRAPLRIASSSTMQEQELAARLLEKLPSLWLQGLIGSEEMSKLKMLIQHFPKQLHPAFCILGPQGEKEIPDFSFAALLLGCLEKAASEAIGTASASMNASGSVSKAEAGHVRLEAHWRDNFMISVPIGGSLYRGIVQLIQPWGGSGSTATVLKAKSMLDPTGLSDVDPRAPSVG